LNFFEKFRFELQVTRNSAKYLTGDPSGEFFAECCQADTQQSERLCRVSPGTLGKDSVSVTRRRNGCFSLPSALWHWANQFAECPRKSTRQRWLCRCTVCRALFAECNTRQRVCRVFLKLCRVLRALGKAYDFGSDFFFHI
jgi:hypothetical protein